MRLSETSANQLPEHWEGKNTWHWDKPVLATEEVEMSDDTKADLGVAIVVLVCAVLMAVHFISGWTFDF